jgi:cell division control protein 6
MTQHANYFDRHSTSQIFESKKPLNTDITPTHKQFVGREEEKAQVADILKDLLRGDIPENFLLTGNTGYGKTACTKLLLNDLDQQMGEDFIYLYISDCPTENKVLREISERLELGSRAKNNRVLYNLIKEEITEKDLKLVIVLDEVDVLFRGRDDHGNPLFKKLFELRGDVLNNSDGCLVLAGVTNVVDIMEDFGPRVKSRFDSSNVIQFSSYNAFQLEKILEKRKQQAFKNGVVKEGVLSKVSAKVAQEDGDARKAIQMLKKAGEIAERNDDEMVRKSHVDQASKLIEKNRVMDAVKSLPKQEKLVLYSILDMRKKQVKTGEVYSHYEKIGKKEDITTLTQRRVGDLIGDLDMQGLITAKTENLSGSRGRTRKIKYDYSTELEEKITEHLEEKLCPK